MPKKAYFVVCVDEDGVAVIDDERAMAVFDGDDVWNEDNSTWVDCYEEPKIWEAAQERLQNALMATWEQD